jgi:spermidine synthase
VGIIGLGTGTLAAYGSKGDVYRFYDINPAVVTIANRDFSYLKDSEATIETALGDARLTLEREPPQGFDLLVVDAFSSDAIPVHLLTAEALAIYLKHMKPGGIIAFHVTNRYLDLVPVAQGLADAHGLHATMIYDPTDDGMTSVSDWVLLSDSKTALEPAQISEVAVDIEPRPDLKLWTDDFNNIVQVLK